ncbi:MAG: hypothetical protein HOE90_12465 [Bacteriovoracaceae bacterium]|jgi:hypothetical protein|nr:hypothetical protein [Bacteriovoracaceae bacterium]
MKALTLGILFLLSTNLLADPSGVHEDGRLPAYPSFQLMEVESAEVCGEPKSRPGDAMSSLMLILTQHEDRVMVVDKNYLHSIHTVESAPDTMIAFYIKKPIRRDSPSVQPIKIGSLSYYVSCVQASSIIANTTPQPEAKVNE